MDITEFLQSPCGKRFTAAMRLAGLRSTTIRNYCRRVNLVAAESGVRAENLTAEHVEVFLQAAAARGLSNSSLIITRVALRLFVTRILQKPWQGVSKPRVVKYRRARSRPLSREEISALIFGLKQTRFRILFAVLYGSGLRASEACNLRLGDLDFSRNCIYVRDGKGGRHREAILPGSLLDDLRAYIGTLSAGGWLFPSGRMLWQKETLFPVPDHERPLSVRSAQRVFSIAVRRLALPGRVSLHSLRHSFATHLVEYGMPLFSVQRLLGHRHLRTTFDYLSAIGLPVVADFSPYDRLPQTPRNGVFGLSL